MSDKTPKNTSGGSRHRLALTELFPYAPLDLHCRTRALEPYEAPNRFGNHADEWIDRDGHPPVHW